MLYLLLQAINGGAGDGTPQEGPISSESSVLVGVNVTEETALKRV